MSAPEEPAGGCVRCGAFDLGESPAAALGFPLCAACWEWRPVAEPPRVRIGRRLAMAIGLLAAGIGISEMLDRTVGLPITAIIAIVVSFGAAGIAILMDALWKFVRGAGRAEACLGLTANRLAAAAGSGTLVQNAVFYEVSAPEILHFAVESVLLGAGGRGLLVFGPRARLTLPWSEVELRFTPLRSPIELVGGPPGGRRFVAPATWLDRLLPPLAGKKLMREIEAARAA